MVKRLEQVAAVVIAAGLAIVSYWLFFSWAKSDDGHRPRLPAPAPSLGRPGPQPPGSPGAGAGPGSVPLP
ncbi:hypothetical protein [Cyanobium sp. Morenito 9A2]|uniref:hypothetical protein n=1 Tax=Cyanobium sp. Morenito 9A2 TaxID=2823718 RepID=UPI0020CBC157|nr:hypothetical protein [Cyanobium sp. Morenito 9A2]MCP9849870.1 hypothetical protein [Cyanobium sp. Morenito 9A2]